MAKALKIIGKISRPGDRWTARRRLKSGNPRAIASHNRQVGEVLFAFNQAQSALLMSYLTIVGLDKYEMAREIWENHPSDSRQRALLRAYVRHGLRKRSIRNAFLWAIDAMDNLSKHRNDAVHADVVWHYDRLEPGLLARKSQSARIKDAPLDTIWQNLRGDFAALANYVNDLNLSIWTEASWPLTKRPKLKLLEIKRGVERRGQKAKV